MDISKERQSGLLYLKVWLEEMKTKIVYCGAKEFSGPDPLHTESKANVGEEEAPEDQQREPQLLAGIAEDNLVLANRNHEKEERHALKDNLLKRPKQKWLTQWASHGSMVEERFQGKFSPPH